ncbi:hypothetical protein [Ornithinimicrobium cerasi]|uniref:DUF5709 domain-containing protein n=1 Tax=Ornithinimicrobium cerasi TaxID=2248773 RepID=A0A285VK40_9MICO|nr:hypothetical protein [Ornithinimicrobium cerasi]SOC54474.1 hypothetical protein SAMN05421879_103157 [Ornithinimicrobium cerasi]
MTGQPDGATSPEDLNEEGVGLGMGEDDSTFEPEETPEAVDDPDRPANPGGLVDPDASGGTLSYEQEASASLEAMGEEPPTELSYEEESFARQEAVTTPDELREVDLEDDPDDDAGVPI